MLLPLIIIYYAHLLSYLLAYETIALLVLVYGAFECGW